MYCNRFYDLLQISQSMKMKKITKLKIRITRGIIQTGICIYLGIISEKFIWILLFWNLVGIFGMNFVQNTRRYLYYRKYGKYL